MIGLTALIRAFALSARLTATPEDWKRQTEECRKAAARRQREIEAQKAGLNPDDADIL